MMFQIDSVTSTNVFEEHRHCKYPVGPSLGLDPRTLYNTLLLSGQTSSCKREENNKAQRGSKSEDL